MRSGNSAIGQPGSGGSTEQRLLENHLKFAHRADRAAENPLQMLDRLQQRILLRTGRRGLAATQRAAHRIQTTPQPAQQVINRFQRQGQAQRLRRRLNRTASQQLHQKLPEQDGGARVTRQNLRQKDRKRFAAAPALPAIRAKHPLPPFNLLARFIQIVPVKEAVAVQRPGTAAAEAALLLERKSSLWSCFSSRTKRGFDGAMRAG